jgi:tetratricopeptide (TPR) repeat protein
MTQTSDGNGGKQDQFTSTVYQVFDGIGHNLKTWTVIVLLALCVGGAIAFFTNRSNSREEMANNALFTAQKTLETQLKAMVPPPAQKDADPAKQAPAPGIETVQFKKFDVDAKLGDAVKKFKEVSEQYAGTRAGFEARLALGNLYYSHGEAAKAVSWFEQAVQAAPHAADKAMALSSLGYAQEGAGKVQEAVQTYQNALNQGEASLKGDLLLAIMARCYELMHDSAKARSTYDQILSQLPNTDFSKSAEASKAQLE